MSIEINRNALEEEKNKRANLTEWETENLQREISQRIIYKGERCCNIWEVKIIIFRKNDYEGENKEKNDPSIKEEYEVPSHEEEFIRFIADIAGIITDRSRCKFTKEWEDLLPDKAIHHMTLEINETSFKQKVYILTKLREKAIYELLNKGESEFVKKLLEAFENGGRIEIKELI